LITKVVQEKYRAAVGYAVRVGGRILVYVVEAIGIEPVDRCPEPAKLSGIERSCQNSRESLAVSRPAFPTLALRRGKYFYELCYRKKAGEFRTYGG
jgi:hypothetical protein